MHYHGITKKIVERPLLGRDAGVSETNPILKRIYLARGIKSDSDLQRGLAQLPSPWLLTGMEEMVLYLINAIEQQKKIVIVADFDADGATSCTVGIKGLQLLGAKNVDFIVPNRFEYGYGLTPEIVELVIEKQADVLESVKKILSYCELDFYSPKDEMLFTNGGEFSPVRIYDSNIGTIYDAKLLVVITDGKDVGTIFEAGVAFREGMQICYLWVDHDDSNFNLMLAQSGTACCLGLSTFRKVMEVYKNTGNIPKVDYKGNIE